VTQGFDAGGLARELARRGLMKLGSDGKPQVMEASPIGHKRFYIVKAAIFEEA